MHGGDGDRKSVDWLRQTYYKAAAAINLSGHVIHVSGEHKLRDKL